MALACPSRRARMYRGALVTALSNNTLSARQVPNWPQLP